MIKTKKFIIVRTIVRRYYENNRFEISFFFFKNQQNFCHANIFFSNIAAQLTKQFIIFNEYIYEIVTKYRDIVQQIFYDQWTKLIFDFVRKFEFFDFEIVLMIVIDALNKCKNENDIQKVIHFFAKIKNLKKNRLKIFMINKQKTSIRFNFIKISKKLLLRFCVV